MFLRRLVKWLVAACVAVVLALHEAGAALHLVRNAWQESSLRKAFSGVSLPAPFTSGVVFIILVALVAAVGVGAAVGALYSSRLADSLERLVGRIRGQELPPKKRTPEG
jgi:hypothetical protein